MAKNGPRCKPWAGWMGQPVRFAPSRAIARPQGGDPRAVVGSSCRPGPCDVQTVCWRRQIASPCGRSGDGAAAYRPWFRARITTLCYLRFPLSALNPTSVQCRNIA
ncbi:hypothetical protein SL1157_0728 [Ruegeria lacuscaerulensis ITI-1157]|nr:hypothetical protein SL1157_0728 [Ruegeria lacuscaerulensis ITI-1157]